MTDIPCSDCLDKAIVIFENEWLCAACIKDRKEEAAKKKEAKK